MIIKMPVHYNRENISHGLRAERVDGNDVKVSEKSWSDIIPSSPGRTHG